jgi:hypothetical protein
MSRYFKKKKTNATVKQSMFLARILFYMSSILRRWIKNEILRKKIPVGRRKRRWEKNTKINLLDGKWGSNEWIDLAQNRDRWRALVNTVMNFRVP